MSKVMIIFLYGPDTYRSRQKLNEIIEHYKKIHKSGLNFKILDLEEKEISYQDFRDEFQQASMFKEKKLAILINIFLNQEFKENFLKNAKKFIDSKDLILLYEKNEVLSADPLFKFLKKEVKSQEFKPLERQKLKNWIKKEFGNYQMKIEPGVSEKLINFVGNDLWRLSNEIKKLVSYKSKCRNIEISRKDVELLVKPEIETDIFATIDAIASKNKRQAFELLHQHLEKGDSPLYLLSMINFQFRNLLVIKNLIKKQKSYSSIIRISKLHPYIIKKSYFQARKFTFEELKKIYQKIFQTDFGIKTGRIDPQTALDLLIAEI